MTRSRSRTPLLEQLVGPRRVKAFRRRAGVLAIGAGVNLLRPRLSRAALGARVGVGVLAAVGGLYVVGTVGALVR